MIVAVHFDRPVPVTVSKREFVFRAEDWEIQPNGLTVRLRRHGSEDWRTVVGIGYVLHEAPDPAPAPPPVPEPEPSRTRRRGKQR